MREKKSKETAEKNGGKDSKSSNDPADSTENNPNSDLITSTIEETECDWEFAHVIY